MNLLKMLFATCLLIAGASPAHAADKGIGDNEILIGQFAALSGPAAQLGQRMRVGILAYFNKVNAEGGINGRRLRLISRDDGYEPERAAQAVKALIEDERVFALVGSVGTPTTLAAVPAINAEGIPLVGPFTGAEALRQPFNRNIFHVRASYYDETERIVEHLTTVGIKRIAVFHQNDSYGKAGLDGVMRALARRDMKPVGITTVERNSVDVSAAIKGIRASRPEAVVQISAYRSCAALIKEARAAGYHGHFLNVSFVGSQALADELGPVGVGVTISQVVPSPFAKNSRLVQEYAEDLRDDRADYTSLEGYLAAKVLVEGIRRSGRNLTRQNLVRSLETLRDFDLGGFRVSYSAESHQGSKFIDMTMIGTGGRFVR